MKKLSTSLLANLVATKRKELKLTQQDLADATGINRAQISRLEKEDYLPSIPQLEQLGETLGFEPDEVFVDNSSNKLPSPSPLNIAVAGTGYVGLSIATLLAQHNHVTAVDIVPEKVEMISRSFSYCIAHSFQLFYISHVRSSLFNSEYMPTFSLSIHLPTLCLSNFQMSDHKSFD